MLRTVRTAMCILILFTLITGVIYPFAVTVLSQTCFAAKANGSWVYEQQRIAGSSLIGQPFHSPQYFWGRLSATSPNPYNAAASSGSNLGPNNPALLEVVKNRVNALKMYKTPDRPIPVDLVTASASGLDPHISQAAAEYQLLRVAEERKMDVAVLNALIEKHTEPRQFGVLGEPRVNVLQLNIALDALVSSEPTNHE